jgi:competence protein ComEA
VELRRGSHDRIDVNRASVEELTVLPGIGPALASRIVESRESHGPFRTPEELLRVRGIGPGILEKIRTRIRQEK